MKMKNLMIASASLFLASTAYASLYISPVHQHQANHQKPVKEQIVIGFANNIPLCKVIHSVYSGYQIKYWEINKDQRLSWGDNQSTTMGPLKYMKTAYHIHVYANSKTKIVGVAKDADIARALTTAYRSVWPLKKGAMLKETLMRWAREQKRVIKWQIPSNPKIKHNDIVLGTFDYALNYIIANKVQPLNSAIVERSKDGKTFYVLHVEKVRALYAPKIKGNPVFVAHNGTLLENVQRFAKKFHYQLEWKVEDGDGELINYQWIGDQKITAQNPPLILKQMLSHYPVMVNIFEGNRVITVKNPD